MAISAATTEHRRTAHTEPSFAHLVHSEWIKIRTVRSTLWCLLVLTAAVIGIGFLAVANRNAHADHLGPLPIGELVIRSHIGLSLGQLAVVVLAARSIGGEYGTGLISTSLTAVPWRKRWLAAKALVVAAVALVAGVLLSAAAFALLYAITPAVSGPVMHPEVVRAVLGGGPYLAGLALLAFAVATVTRSSVGGIVVVSAMSFVIPVMSMGVPGFDGLLRFLPSGLFPGNAGWAIMQPGPMLNGLSPWAGFAVLCAWVAAGMAVAAYLLDRRDA
ncbi:ABC transporter permease [Streptomyces sp. NPDC001793]|uniref:ABC transporter permease n=1 Tax=Streptomyces sp. NPDC001793 TaxID=3154657 RepID=UPI00331C51FB